MLAVATTTMMEAASSQLNRQLHRRYLFPSGGLRFHFRPLTGSMSFFSRPTTRSRRLLISIEGTGKARYSSEIRNTITQSAGKDENSYPVAEKDGENLGTDLPGNVEDTVQQKSVAKIHDFCFGIPFGGLILSRGLIGFLFSRNATTLTTGLVCGGSLLALAVTSLKVWRQGGSSLPFILGQAGVAAALLWKDFHVYSLTKRLFPTGFYIVVSMAMLGQITLPHPFSLFAVPAMTKSNRKGAENIKEENSTKMEDDTGREEEDPRMIVLRTSSLPLALFAAERKMSGFSDVLSAADMGMRTSILGLEHLLGYDFRDKTLLIKALTHSSYAEGESYQRLEFVGDAVLGLAITNHIYLIYPDLDPGQLSNLRAANVSTEKLARVAIRHNLYSHLRRHAPALDEKVREFTEAVRYHADEVPYDGKVKAPKVLADIVESIAAAVYVDCGFDLKVLWLVFRALLEPIVTTETLQQQPVTMLFEFCQKTGKKLDIRFWKKGSKTIANVYVDGKMRGSGWSEQKEIAKLYAAKAALQKLQEIEPPDVEMDVEVTEEGAKQRLNELCSKNRWLKPVYKLENEEGPAHGKLFTCSVEIEVVGIKYVSYGDTKSRVKDAESSAACILLNALQSQESS